MTRPSTNAHKNIRSSRHFMRPMAESLEARKLMAVSPGWVVQAGGTLQERGSSTAVDAVGNAYIAGYFTGSIDLNDDAVADLTSAGDKDGFVAKYDPNGSLLWAMRIGGPVTTQTSPSESVSGVTVASDGGVFISGVFAGTAEFGGPGLTLTSAGDRDVFAARLDPATGSVLWASRMGGSKSDFNQNGGITADDSGVFVTGYFGGSANFGSTVLTTTSESIFVTRLDPTTGNFGWARKMGSGSGGESGHALALDDQGNLFATGTFTGTGNFGGVSLTSYGQRDAFVVRLNAADGAGVWGVNMGSSYASQEDVGQAIDTDAAGNIYVTGIFNRTATFGPFTLTASGTDPRGAFAVGISPTGTVQWARHLGSPTEFGNGTGIAVDSETSSVYVTGRLGSAQLARMDLDGNVDWSRTLGSSLASFGRGVAVDSAGVLRIVGMFIEPTIFDTGTSSTTLTSRGDSDAYLMRYDPFSAGIRVSPTSGLVTTEAGGTAAFSVVLTTQPTADVTIPVSSGDASEGVVSTSLLTFTPADWNVPQTVTITGVDDAAVDGDVAYSIILGASASADPAYDGFDPADVAVKNNDDDAPPTKFFVVNDGSPDRTFEYGPTGSAVENYALNAGNTAPRGAAATAAGEKVWVVDANKTVYVYDTAGALLGSWVVGGLANNAVVEGIATDGNHIWLVDARSDKVFRYSGAASRITGSQSAWDSFALNSANTAPKDIVTDGTSIWVVNDASTDKVFKYTVSGTLLGSWTITGAGTAPTGITLDPAGGGDMWIVDSGTDRVYEFAGARSLVSGSLAPSTSFALAAGNTNPQGIADPPVSGSGQMTPTVQITVAKARAASRPAPSITARPWNAWFKAFPRTHASTPFSRMAIRLKRASLKH